MHVLAEPIQPLVDAPRRHASGRGSVTLSRVAGSTVVTRASATSPLKLLTPRSRSDAAWIFTSTYGGGLLGADTITLDLHAEPGTRGLLSTQASTKVYRSLGGTARQELNVGVDDDAVVVCAPDPI